MTTVLTICRVCGEELEGAPVVEGHAYVCSRHLDESEPPTGSFVQVAQERVRRLHTIRTRLGLATISTRQRKDS